MDFVVGKAGCETRPFFISNRAFRRPLFCLRACLLLPKTVAKLYREFGDEYDSTEGNHHFVFEKRYYAVKIQSFWILRSRTRGWGTSLYTLQTRKVASFTNVWMAGATGLNEMQTQRSFKITNPSRRRRRL